MSENVTRRMVEALPSSLALHEDLSKVSMVGKVAKLQIPISVIVDHYSAFFKDKLDDVFRHSVKHWINDRITQHDDFDQAGLLFPIPVTRSDDERSNELDRLRSREQLLVAENEKLKSQLIASYRQVIETHSRLEDSQRQIERLEHHNDKQLDHFSDVLKLASSMQRTVVNAHDGDLCMREEREGIVINALDDGIVVEFNIDDEPVEQFYNTSQFVKGRMPEEGDRLKVTMFAAKCPPPSIHNQSSLSGQAKREFTGFQRGIDRARKQEGR